jgi:hypothetical protein
MPAVAEAVPGLLQVSLFLHFVGLDVWPVGDENLEGGEAQFGVAGFILYESGFQVSGKEKGPDLRRVTGY